MPLRLGHSGTAGCRFEKWRGPEFTCEATSTGAATSFRRGDHEHLLARVSARGADGSRSHDNEPAGFHRRQCRPRTARGGSDALGCESSGVAGTARTTGTPQHAGPGGTAADGSAHGGRGPALASGDQSLPRDLRRTAFTRRAFGRVHVTTRGVDPAALRLPRRIGARLPAFLAPPAASAITVCATLRPTRLLPRLVTANGVSQSRSALLDPRPRPPSTHQILCVLLPSRLVTANGVSQSRSALLDPLRPIKSCVSCFPPAASFDPSNPVCLASDTVTRSRQACQAPFRESAKG